jgi:prepilin-type N-terminal cleavage/methylation domain-containing protein
MRSYSFHIRAFTLLELSVVLVIIGLIVGGIMTGQSLISTSAIRAQVSQITKYQSAVAAFQNKYNGLPGDLVLKTATLFGFYAGASCDGVSAGMRNGDGVINGYNGGTGILTGESGMFWWDLSTAGYIESTYPNASAPYFDCVAPGVTVALTAGTQYLGDYFPQGKIGHGTFVYVYNYNTYNWFGLSALTSVSTSNATNSNTGISPNEAYGIDKKMDDGLPTTGTVQAIYDNGVGNSAILPAPNAPNDNSTTCYNTTSNIYSRSPLANHGTGPNCALSFQFNSN